MRWRLVPATSPWPSTATYRTRTSYFGAWCDASSRTGSPGCSPYSTNPIPSRGYAGTVRRHLPRHYTPSEKARVLEYAADHGVTAAAKHFGTSRFSIYDWRRHPGLRPSQIRNQLRRKGYPQAPPGVHVPGISFPWEAARRTGLTSSRTRATASVSRSGASETSLRRRKALHCL